MHLTRRVACAQKDPVPELSEESGRLCAAFGVLFLVLGYVHLLFVLEAPPSALTSVAATWGDLAAPYPTEFFFRGTATMPVCWIAVLFFPFAFLFWLLRARLRALPWCALAALATLAWFVPPLVPPFAIVFGGLSYVLFTRIHEVYCGLPLSGAQRRALRKTAHAAALSDGARWRSWWFFRWFFAPITIQVHIGDAPAVAVTATPGVRLGALASFACLGRSLRRDNVGFVVVHRGCLVTSDAATLRSCGMADGDVVHFIIVSATKRAAKAKPTDSAEAEPNTTAEPTATEPTATEPTATEPTATEPASAPPASSQPTFSTPATAEPAPAAATTTKKSASKPTARRRIAIFRPALLLVLALLSLSTLVAAADVTMEDATSTTAAAGCTAAAAATLTATAVTAARRHRGAPPQPQHEAMEEEHAPPDAYDYTFNMTAYQAGKKADAAVRVLARPAMLACCHHRARPLTAPPARR